MKYLIIWFVGLIFSVNVNAQTSQLLGIHPMYNGGSRPLEGKTFDYTISMTGGKYATSVSLRCTNGIFTANNSSVYNNYVTNTFSVKVKWGNAGPGEIYAEDASGYRYTYSVEVEKPAVSISGPSSVKYDNYVEYTLSANPNISITSATWGNSSDFRYIEGQGTSKYKVLVSNNDSKTIDNAITVTAITDYGTLKANKTVSIEPVFAINTNQSLTCNGDNISYSLPKIDGAIIVWQAGNNMTLISGQGTETATYQASGNGYGTVKATLTYKGKEYIVENSNIWVGPPAKFEKIASRYPNALLEQDPLNPEPIHIFKGGDIESLSAIGPPPYSNGLEWEARNAQIIKLEESSVTVIFDNPLAPFRFLAEISLMAKNKCGTSQYMIGYGAQVENNPWIPVGPAEPLLFNSPSLKSSVSLPVITPATVKVYNFNTGTLVYSEKNVIGFNIKDIPIDRGIYIVVTTDANGETKSEKMIK